MSILMSSPGLTRGSKMQRIIQNSQITGSSPVKTRKREPEYMIILKWNRYISNRDRFKENMFPIFTLKIHKENDLKLHPEVYQQLTELWNYLLIKSSAFGDFQMGMDLLSEKYSIDFDKPTIQSAIDSINTCLQGYELPPTKKIKKEHETPSESDVFLNLLKSKRH